MQSHTAAATDFLNCTTTVTSTPSAQTIKKPTEIGRWETATTTAATSLIEPLQIHLPVTSFTTTPVIKSENISSGSSTSSSSSSKTPTSTSTGKRGTSKSSKSNRNINECILNLHQQHHNKSTTESTTKFDGTGCSRTLPITWNSSGLVNNNGNNVGDTTTLLQIKREPCQVSEVTTSNNLLATTSFSAGTPTIIKIEQKSPTSTSQSNITSITSSSASMDASNNSGGHSNGKRMMLQIFNFIREFRLTLQKLKIKYCKNNAVTI